MLTSLAVLGLSVLGGPLPQDQPIEPIPAALIEIAIEAGVLDETCVLYSTLIPLLTIQLDGNTELAIEVVDAFAIVSIEEGWEPSGRLTDEAREALTDYLHEC